MNALHHVRTGMRVVDASGEEVGTVDDLKMGDPGAVTAAGQTSGQGDPISEVAADLTGREPDVPPQQAERMLREGYLKVDGKGLFSTDFYARAEQVARVEGDTVHLGVGRDELTDKR